MPTTILQGPFPAPYWTSCQPLSLTHTHTYMYKRTQIYADIYMHTHASVFCTQRDGLLHLQIKGIRLCAHVCHIRFCPNTQQMVTFRFFSTTMTTRLRV